MHTLGVLVEHELKLLVRNKRLVWSHVLAMLGGFALFAESVHRGRLALAIPFFLIMLLVPTLGAPAAIGVHMFVGEKERRTMEPLLLLPVPLRTLLGAKFVTMLAVSFAELVVVLFGEVAALRTWGSPTLYALAVNSTTLYIAGLLLPLLGVFIGLLVLIVSARATNTQSATQMIMFVMLIPMMSLITVVTTYGGLNAITWRSLEVGTGALAILNLLAYGIARRGLTPAALIRKRGQ